MERAKLLACLAVGLAVGALVGFWLRLPTARPEVESKVRSFYELVLPGVTAEVVSLTEESGLFKAVIKLTDPTGVSWREVWVSRDGQILTETVIYLERSIEQIRRMKDFVDCLFDEGVRIFGMLNATVSPAGAQATALQLNLLGRYSPKLYVSCDGPALQTCLDMGITQLPSVVIRQRAEPGVKTADWLAEQTGCEL
jgi:hypothetical protein